MVSCLRKISFWRLIVRILGRSARFFQRESGYFIAWLDKNVGVCGLKFMMPLLGNNRTLRRHLNSWYTFFSFLLSKNLQDRATLSGQRPFYFSYHVNILAIKMFVIPPTASSPVSRVNGPFDPLGMVWSITLPWVRLAVRGISMYFAIPHVSLSYVHR